MVSLTPGAVLSASNPLLATWIASSFGFLQAPDALAWVIYDVSTEEKELAPLTVASGTVNLTADKVSAGRYAVAWTVPATIGRMRIAWTATVTSTDSEGTATTRTLTWTRDFEVLTSAQPIHGYALVSDMRAEGISESKVSDSRLLTLIREASTQFDKWTGRWFDAQYKEWRLDGSGRSTLLLDHPVVAVDSATIFGQGPIASDTFKVYNRQLTGLADDRAVPKLEFFITQPGLQGPVQPLAYPYPISAAWVQPMPWAKGTQNVALSGVFGYTEADGSCEGATPALVTEAVKLLVLRKLPRMARAQDRFDALNQNRIRTEKTREQSYELVPGRAGSGAYSGDISIDDIVEQFSRPPLMSVV